MPTYHIWTIGCQMNKAESERIAAGLEERGYKASKSVNDADLIVLNSCVVRQSAEDKVVNKLHDVRHLKKEKSEMLLALTGCMVDSDIKPLKKKFPFIDYLFKAGEYPPWQEKTEETTLPLKPTPSVYVSISQGCDNFCAYCIVPYRRGRERSRPMEEIVCEAEELARRGAKEIVLLGQNVDSYGHDLHAKPDLADLLKRLNGVEGLKRLRFLTNHPKDMSDKLISAIAELDKVCEHINLPIQAGSDEILKAMNRGYTAAQYLKLVENIRKKIPHSAITTDIIVGFPGETEKHFMETLDLLSKVNFDTVHVAAYSVREGTKAARELEDDVPLKEKKARLNRVEALQEKVQSAINSRLMGKAVEILVEGKNKGKWYGRTRTDKLVFFQSEKNHLGQLIHVKIDKTSAWSLQGIIK